MFRSLEDSFRVLEIGQQLALFRLSKMAVYLFQGRLRD